MERSNNYKNAGTTMVETLVAFTVLAVILVILLHIVKFSSELRTEAVDMAHLNQMFLREVYKNYDNIDSTFIKKTAYSCAGEEGTQPVTFYLQLDEGRTNMEYYRDAGNYVPDQEGEIYFRLNCLGAKTFLCTDSIIEAEQIPAPAMMNFIYETPEQPEEEQGEDGETQSP